MSLLQALCKKNISINILLKVFDTKVGPILTYGSAVWGTFSLQSKTMYDKFGSFTPEQYFMKTDTELTCTYDFSTLYTSIPHNLLKSRITALIHNSFKRRNGSNRYTHIKITSGKGYFIDTINPGGDNLYTADQIDLQNGGVFD